MKQIYQNVSTGETILEKVPVPQCRKGHVLIRSSCSLISAGTERMLVDFGKSNYLQKAKKQPDKVAMVLDKVKSDGLLPTIDAVRSKLNQPLPMGYSNVGVVEEVGDGVSEFKVGDRVVSNGSHAEVVCVPKHLVAAIPDEVADETAVYTVVGSIALQGIRLTAPTLGECIVVMGLGLIGLMTVQILRANGCRVLGLDYDADKVNLAKSFGAEALTLSSGEDPIDTAAHFSRGRGVDAVIITASTDSNEPVHNAATICRQKGRIVLVGVVGLNLQRSDFYEKEISFRVSCSYGPGRYDPFYEDEGNDYPIGYVRWTENRNFEAVLDMFSEKKLTVDRLQSCSFDIESASEAYDKLLTDKNALGILINYHLKNINLARTIILDTDGSEFKGGRKKIVLGLIGAGNHAGRTLLPAFQGNDITFKTISSSQGITGSHYARKFNFQKNTTDTETIFTDEEINTVVIATQHDSHAKFTVAALEGGKNVFVEKPLALNMADLEKIDLAYSLSKEARRASRLMVGFNRRFAPLMLLLKGAVKQQQPMSIVYTCNAGAIPSESWVHDVQRGGGRIIGEACHFIDICRFLTGSPILSIYSSAMGGSVEASKNLDTVTLTVNFENGSIGTIHYFANGHRSFPKERIEVFQSGGVAVLDNFKKLKSYGFKGLKSKSLFRQDKGITDCAKVFFKSIQDGKECPISYGELMEVSKFSIIAAGQLYDIRGS